jgi:cytochrome c oxidase subunit 2
MNWSALLTLLQDSQGTPTDGKSFWGWFPPNINPAYGGTVDNLYLVIMAIVLVAFFATELCIVYCCVAYRAREGRKATYMHGSNKLELLWTVIPAILLLLLAVVQTKSWADIKQNFPSEDDVANVLTVQVMPEQFKWHFRYKNNEEGYFKKENKWDGKFNILTNSQLHIPVNKKVMTKMVSLDVIHSLFVPHARVKQDVLPGMMTRTWFIVDRIPCWNLKTQQLEYLTQADFEKAVVSLYRDKDWKFLREPIGAKTADGKSPSGQYTFKYEPYKGRDGKKEKIKVWKGRQLVDAPWSEVQYVHHYVEIACAELCGLGHTTMRAFLTVHTPDTFQMWVEAQVESIKEDEGQSEDELKVWKIWDMYYPHFNDSK